MSDQSHPPFHMWNRVYTILMPCGTHVKWCVESDRYRIVNDGLSLWAMSAIRADPARFGDMLVYGGIGVDRDTFDLFAAAVVIAMQTNFTTARQ